MAEIPYGGAAQTRGGGQTISTLTSYAGAAVSLALIVGIGVWGYGVLSRDVSGVPVVRAASSEPMRVAPEEPGGQLAAHQGLSVNEVMANGEAERAADRLVLAPKPVDLTDEDQPLNSTVVAAPTAQAPTEAAAEEADPAPLSPQMASIQALAEQLAGNAAPLADVEAAPEIAPEAKVDVAAVAPATVEALPELEPALESAEEEPEAKPVSATIPAASLRPKLRPRVVQASAPAAAEPTAVEQPANGEIAVTAIPAGTRLVQLGAFDSADVARDEWGRLSARFGDYMGDKERVVMKAQSGGRTFYRLRAMGFADLSDARRFCAALLAERADCIPVVSK